MYSSMKKVWKEMSDLISADMEEGRGKESGEAEFDRRQKMSSACSVEDSSSMDILHPEKNRDSTVHLQP